jgi:ABC-type glycerol-3-phosphate transport system substrate-binding protein
MIGTYEAPIWGRNDWLTDLNKYAKPDAKYDVNDLIPSVRKALSANGKLYAVPFYGESFQDEGVSSRVIDVAAFRRREKEATS